MLTHHLTARAIITRRQRGGPAIIAGQAAEVLESFREPLATRVRSFMREGISAELGYFSERESVNSEVLIDGGNPRLKVSSFLVQAAVDETGANFTTLPPFGPGSFLRFWVILKLDPLPKKIYVTARGVARAILERGLPRPMDELRRPFHYASEEFRSAIIDALRAVGARAVVQIKNASSI